MGLEVSFGKRCKAMERFHKVSCENFLGLVYFFSTLRESQLIYLNNMNLHNNTKKMDS